MYTNIRDNNSAVKQISGNIGSIIKKYLKDQRSKGSPLDFVKVEGENVDSKVIVASLGKCQFRFGVKQEVIVHQKPIQKSPTKNGPRN